MAAIVAACSNHSSNAATNGDQSSPAASSAPAAQTAPHGETVAQAGTYFFGKLDRPLSTKKNKNGDNFTLVETTSKPFSLAGSEIDGHITDVQSAGPNRTAKMTLVFDDIRLFDGTKAPVDVEFLSAATLSPKTPQADIVVPPLTLLELRFKSSARATATQ